MTRNIANVDNISEIRVRVIAASVTQVKVIPESSQSECPRCQSGQGCGNIAWFRGLSHDTAALTLPQTEQPLQIGEIAVLYLANSVINRLSLYTYAMPLMVFVLTLYLTHSFASELLQLLCALFSSAASFILLKRHTSKLLQSQLHLQRVASPLPLPNRYCVKKPSTN